MQGSNLRDIQNLDTTVVGLQGNPISADVPAVGQSLVWDGTEWSPTNLAVGISEADGDVRYVERAGDSMFGTLIFPGPSTGVDINDGSIHLNRSDLLMVGNTGLERVGLARTGSAQGSGIPLVWSDTGSLLAQIVGGRATQGSIATQVYDLIGGAWRNVWATRQAGGLAYLQIFADPVQSTDVATKGYVDSLMTGGSTTLIGVFEADTDTCHYATSLPYPNPGPLVAPGIAGAGAYLICDEAGTMPPTSEAAGLTFVVGDWVISDGTDWVKLSVGTPNLSASAIAVFPSVAGAENVQDALQAMLPTAGGAMTGPLELAANAAAPLQPVSLQQLTTSLAAYLPLAGGTLTGNLIIQRSDAQFRLNSIGNGSRATLFWGSDTNTHFSLFRNNGATILELDRFDDTGAATTVLAINRNTGAIALGGGSTLTLTGNATFPLQPVTLQQATATYAPISNPTFIGTVTAPKISTTGINFGSATASSPTDLTRHIALWGGTAPTTPGFGFSITSGTLNYVVSASSNMHDFYVATDLVARLNGNEFAMQGARDMRARNFYSNVDGGGFGTNSGGLFYKKVGTGVVIRQSSANQQPQIENSDGTNIRPILDTLNGVARNGSSMTGNLNMQGNFIINLADPGTNVLDAANKRYVDNQDALRVAKAGDTMTGGLTINAGGLTMGAGNVRLRSTSNSADGGQVLQWQDATARLTGQIRTSQNGTVIGSGQMGSMEFAVTDGNGNLQRFAYTRYGVLPRLALDGAPINAEDVATKGYVDSSAGVPAPGAWETHTATGNFTGTPRLRSRLLLGGQAVEIQCLTQFAIATAPGVFRSLLLNPLPVGKRPPITVRRNGEIEINRMCVIQVNTDGTINVAPIVSTANIGDSPSAASTAAMEFDITYSLT